MSKIVSLTRAASQKAVALHRRALLGLAEKAKRQVKDAEFNVDVAEAAANIAWSNLSAARRNRAAVQAAVDAELSSLPGA